MGQSEAFLWIVARRGKGDSIVTQEVAKSRVPEAVFSVTLRKPTSAGENKSHVEVRREEREGGVLMAVRPSSRTEIPGVCADAPGAFQ